MDALFSEAFRQELGLPLDYERILQSTLSADVASTSPEATPPTFPSAELPSSDADLAVNAPPALSPSEEELLTLVDDSEQRFVADSPRERVTVQSAEAIVALASPGLVMRTCSVCAKQFEKTKSRQGTRC